MEWELFSSSDTSVMTIRLVIAALLGGLVGVEREYHQHPAGFRTHLLVSVGSCLIMLLAFYGFQGYMKENPDVVNFDPSRLAAYVVSGIGFLGAGTILVQGYTVRGLTTAASIWVVAGIGLTVGAGMYTAAFICTIIVILSLFLLGKINFNILNKGQNKYIFIVVDERQGRLNEIVSVLEDSDVKIKGVKTERQRGYKGNNLIEYRLLVNNLDHKSFLYITERLNKLDFVDQINMDGN
ncbi:MgtC/SapB family protein [Evansella sp. AB-P1]|uniref:MgtC/SapB family protein n=1 Tax=Evansella sp. AB-P1 TaxID=3037653 RepID=UPI00241F8ECB|nr:MgtC/SapB family protein [Evansella sp. AB-P1]MDG5788150.1 MgtC/SapB family protein [Evansella sp. AB-P1]